MTVPLCDDWSCPAQVSCALHLRRSRAYAAMDMPPPKTRMYDRSPGTDSCAEYIHDQPRAWLLDMHEA